MKSSTPSVPSDQTSTSSSSSTTKDTPHIECPEKRLRRTNAFEECGDLLDEIEAPPTTQNWRGRRVQGQGQGHHDITQTSTGHPKILPHPPQQDGWKEPEATVVENVHITLDTAGIRSGDLLLFEDGPVLQRGIVKLSVYLWIKNLETLLTPATSAHESVTASATAATASSDSDISAPAAPGKNSSGHRQGQGQGQGQGQSGRGSERGGGRSRRRDSNGSNGRDGRRSKGEGGSTSASGDGAPVQAAAQSVRTSSEKLGAMKSVVKSDTKIDVSGQASTTTVLELVEREVVKEEVAELNAFATAVKERSKHLLPLFVAVPISLPEESSLLQLQKAVWTGLQGEAVALALKGVLPSWKGKYLLHSTFIFYFTVENFMPCIQLSVVLHDMKKV